MKYETKLALQIFILGVIILLIGYYIAYKYNYMTNIQREFGHTSSLVNELSVNFEQRLLEKVKTNQTLSTTPILKNKLIESNNTYDNYSDKERDTIIILQNNKWKAIINENDAFILEFTNNEVAQFLKEQQKNLPREYGEIFLTNKYGVIIASTSKLTTLAHAHKYWWKGAYNNGEGAVFFDDRGYDESVGGYVLGLVIPIKEDSIIIGILKVNLNILGSISEMLASSQNEKLGEFKLIRSGGEIIFDNKNASLSNRIPNLLYEKIQIGDKEPFIFQNSTDNQLIGMSEITITSENVEGFHFGGSFESLDHIKGNTGESWFIINYRSMDSILKPLKNYTFIVLAIGFLLIIIMAVAALILGKLIAKPLKQLIEQNTISIKNLESEISQRLKAERELKKQNEEYASLNEEYKKTNEELLIAKEKAEESEKALIETNKSLQDMVYIASHDLQVPLVSMEGYATELLENNKDKLDEEGFYCLTRLQANAQRMHKLVLSLLDISRLNTKKNPHEKFNLSEIIDKTLKDISLTVEKENVNIIYEKLPGIYGDKQRIEGVFRNLILNSIIYKGKNIVIGFSNNIFYVKDDGIGIPESQLERIFNPGERLKVTKADGVGMGLTFSKKVIEQHKGKIWAESDGENKGTTIYIELNNNILTD